MPGRNAYLDGLLGMLGEAKLPGGLIYASDDGSWRLQMRDPVLWAFFAVVVAILLRRILYRRIARAFGALRLSAAMSGLFVLLSIPVLIFILAYNYWQNSATINATLNDVVAKTKRASIDDAQSLINPVAATLELLGSVAAQDPRDLQEGREPGVSLSGVDRSPADRCRLCELRRRLSPRRDPDRRRPQALRSLDSAVGQLAFQLYR